MQNTLQSIKSLAESTIVMTQPQQVQQPWPLLASQHFAWDPYSSYTSTASAFDRAVLDRNGYAVLSPTTVITSQQLFASPNELQTDLPAAYLQSIPGIVRVLIATMNSLAVAVTERMLPNGNNSTNVSRPIVFEEKCVGKKGPRK